MRRKPLRASNSNENLRRSERLNSTVNENVCNDSCNISSNMKKKSNIFISKLKCKQKSVGFSDLASVSSRKQKKRKICANEGSEETNLASSQYFNVFHSLPILNTKRNESESDKILQISESLSCESKIEKLSIPELLKYVESDNNCSSSLVAKYESDNSSGTLTEDDWEEVNNIQKNCQDIEISVNLPTDFCIKKKRKKTSQEILQAFFDKKMRDYCKKQQENLHKVHLLVLFSHYLYLNKIINFPELLASALSNIPSSYSYPLKRTKLEYVSELCSWVLNKYPLNKNPHYPHYPLVASTNECCSKLSIASTKCLKCSNCGYEIVPENYSIKDIILCAIQNNIAQTKEEQVLLFILTARALGFFARLVVSLPVISLKPPLHMFSSLKLSSSKSKKLCVTPDSFNFPIKSATEEDLKKKSEIDFCKTVVTSKNLREEPEVVAVIKNDMLNKKSNLILSPDLSPIKQEFIHDEDTDFLHPKVKLTNKTSIRGKNDSKISPNKIKTKLYMWAEIFLEEEQIWLPVDVPTGKVHCISEIEKNCGLPLYIFGFNNNNEVKDITCRYASQWLTSTQKCRVDFNWLQKFLYIFQEPKCKRSQREDKLLHKILVQRPIPSTLSQIKGHPLYVLSRHLLKFEAIYPQNTSPVGYINGEPVYPRKCIQKLHSRETWLKEARVVKCGEMAYKTVCSRPRYMKRTGQVERNLPLELFGFWQTECYIPPVAADGKVPRNAYGNVDLFQPSMIPKGTVLLDLPGLPRVARKLGIDYAAAIIGFDVHSGSSHPVMGGWIVCQEFKTVLLDALNEEQKQQEQKEIIKRSKLIYNRWKQLVNGVLIRQKLQTRYNFKYSMSC